MELELDEQINNNKVKENTMKKLILSIALITSACAGDRDVMGTANPANPRQQLQSNMDFLKKGMLENQEMTVKLQKVNATILKLKQENKQDPRIAKLGLIKENLEKDLGVLRANLKEKSDDVQKQAQQHKANNPTAKVESSLFQKVISVLTYPLKWLGLVS